MFYQTVESAQVKDIITHARACLQQGDRQGYDRYKRGLPAFIFMATMEANNGKDGKRPLGHWRLQAAARLNGLVMHDFDHLSDKGLTPQQLYDKIPMVFFDDVADLCIMLIHVTPSGDGLRVVTTTPTQYTIEQAQERFALALGVERDGSIKNADRISFACTREDILYINQRIFDYDNPDYDTQHGSLYRSSGSRGTAHSNNAAAASGVHTGNTPAPDKAKDTGQHEADKGRHADAGARLKATDLYHGVAYQKIVYQWLSANGGTPQVGDRHKTALKLMGDLRYILDNNADNLLSVLSGIDWFQEWMKTDEQEIRQMAADVCTRQLFRTNPKRLREVLASLGIRDDDGTDQQREEQRKREEAATEIFAQRLKPLLAEPYTCACAQTSPDNGIAAVFAAGTMYCTLMTRTYYRHYDGNMQRMNPQTLLIGEPASGKSFACTLDDNIMEAMRAADEPGREAERQYKLAQKERATSSKAQKSDPLKKPEMVIRYLPSRTSNAVFYARQRNARETINGETMPLHLYCFDSELDSSITAQSGGAWIGKHDLELKAFHNETSGVDYANGDSVNDTIKIYYNTVTTGTKISLAKKFNMRNINDGLCTRVAIAGIKSQKYKMLTKNIFTNVAQQREQMRQWGYEFSEMSGELHIEKLVEAVYDYGDMLAQRAGDDSDDVLDLLRKRAAFYAIWFTVPRIYGRQWKKYKETGKVTVDKKDIAFAELIYDAVIYWQDHFFGKMLEDTWNDYENRIQVRNHKSKTVQVYALLPEVFTLQDVKKLNGTTESACRKLIENWKNSGYIVKSGNRYKKKITQII